MASVHGVSLALSAKAFEELPEAGSIYLRGLGFSSKGDRTGCSLSRYGGVRIICSRRQSRRWRSFSGSGKYLGRRKHEFPHFGMLAETWMDETKWIGKVRAGIQSNPKESDTQICCLQSSNPPGDAITGKFGNAGAMRIWQVAMIALGRTFALCCITAFMGVRKSHAANGRDVLVARGRHTSNFNANPMEKWFGRRSSDEEDGDEDGDMLREECGVVGIFGDSEASRLCYLSLHALQHRGQEGAGIVACNEGSLNSVTGMGLVSEVFNQTALSKLSGTSAVGHVRYATAGESVLKNVQPFVAGYRFGSVGVAHNGNLVNYNELRAMLEEGGSIFNTSSDTEVVLHLIAISKARPFIARLVDACQQLEGAYSMVFLTEDKLVAVRDPYGFRPLVMGYRSNGAVVFASETCALDLIEATYEREINPGEVVVVDKDGISSLCLMPQRQRKACIFEHIYFALPNSIVFGLSVYQSRYKIGEILASESPVDCDVVIAVPDSGVVAALGYAAKAGVPFQQGLIRSHYVGRTFIEPSQKIRDFGVKLKLAPVKAVLEGKRVVVVDDSIVRGTTSSKIVRLIKEAGATEVHLRIASPPITGSCYYGVDTPSKEELISYRLSVEETRKYVGADSLAFLPLERLSNMLGVDSPNFCYACFTGDYPVPPKTLSKDAVEKETAHKVLVDGLVNSLNGDNSQAYKFVQ